MIEKLKLDKKKSIKVAMVAACPFPANHGTPAAIKEMSEYLGKKLIDVHVITYPIYDKNIPFQPIIKIHRCGDAQEKEIKVGPFKERIWYDVKLTFKLIQVIKQVNTNVIHAHNYEGLLAGLIAKFFTGRPLIYNAINTMEEELPSYDLLKPKILFKYIGKFLDGYFPKKADFVIADTPELKNLLIKLGVDKKKIQWIPSGVDLSFFDVNDAAICQIQKKYNIEKNKKIIIYTGTLDQFQGIDILINAFSYVKKEIKSACLIIAGSTVKKSHREYYENMTKELEIRSDVLFIEPDLKEVPALLKIAHIAVVPRVTSMGIPTKLLNYLAAQCAVVSFKGAAHFLKNFNGVHLVEGNDFHNLAKGIIYLLNNQERREELRKKGRNIIERYYSWDIICDKIIEIYERLIYENT